MILEAIAFLTMISPFTKESVPIVACDIRTLSWCLSKSPMLIDLHSADKNLRLWTLRDEVFKGEVIYILEDGACGSSYSDIQVRTERVGQSRVDLSKKYIVDLNLRKDGCNITIELPLNEDGQVNDLAYFMIKDIFRVCRNISCSMNEGTPLGAFPIAKPQ